MSSPASPLRRSFHLGCAAALLLSGCLSQSYEISAPELQRLVELAPEQRGEHVRVTQQTAFANDASDLPPEVDAADWALIIASQSSSDDEHHHHHHHDNDDDDDDAIDGSAEEALATALVAVAVAATVAVSVGVTEGARFDGWVQAPAEHPVLLVEPSGERRWARLGTLTPDLVRGVERAVLPDYAGDLERLERHPLDRAGFVYQLELGAEPAPFEGASLAFSGRAGLGFMPSQRYGFLLGAAFSSASAEATGAPLGPSTTLSFDHRVFLQAEAWPVAAGRLHLGPYGELGYAWARADDPLGTRTEEGWMLGAGAALQLDWTTRLALTVRAGAAWLPSVEFGTFRAFSDYRIAPTLTVGFSIY
ncbi:MAG TPA: hypothetical protein VNN80_29735 [Polyangiaceae bacterium]|nr:hypothetical protein [Polyangiaceae bacterium]